MILHLIPKLNSYSIILASGSPRRKEILDKIGLKFSVVSSTFEENYKLEDFDNISAFAIATAEGKALEVRNRLSSSSEGVDIIIGCDTCVYHNGKVYGKPKSPLETAQMIRKWSGESHDVTSGVCVTYRTKKKGDWQNVTFSETTSVKFDSNISDELIEAYLKTGDAGHTTEEGLSASVLAGKTTEMRGAQHQTGTLAATQMGTMGLSRLSFDKAGGYGIQGIASCLIQSIGGCYYNVMGFPLNHFCRIMSDVLNEMEAN